MTSIHFQQSMKERYIRSQQTEVIWHRMTHLQFNPLSRWYSALQVQRSLFMLIWFPAFKSEEHEVFEV